jgi:hypothetical protein
VIAGRVEVVNAVKEVVEAGGFERAMQGRRQPEGDQGEGENAAQTLHGTEKGGVVARLSIRRVRVE